MSNHQPDKTTRSGKADEAPDKPEQPEMPETGSQEADAVIEKLGAAIPQLGSAVSGVADPLNVLFKAFESDMERIKEWDQELDAIGAKAAERADQFRRLRDAQVEAAKGAAALNAELGKVHENFKTSADEAERLVKGIHSYRMVTRELRVATEGTTPVRFHEMEAPGPIGPGNAAVARNETDLINARQRDEIALEQAHRDAAHPAPDLANAARSAQVNANDPPWQISLEEADEPIANEQSRQATRPAAQPTSIGSARLTDAQPDPRDYGKLAQDHATLVSQLEKLEGEFSQWLLQSGEATARRLARLAQDIAALKASETLQDAQLNSLNSRSAAARNMGIN